MVKFRVLVGYMAGAGQLPFHCENYSNLIRGKSFNLIRKNIRKILKFIKGIAKMCSTVLNVEDDRWNLENLSLCNSKSSSTRLLG